MRIETREATRKPLRLWPGVVAVVLLWLVRYGLPVVVPESEMYAVIGELVGGVVVLLWWMFFSRAAWSERLGALLLMAAGLAATPRILDRSVATGMMGLTFWIYVIPVLSLALVAWAVATHRLPDRVRRVTMAATILLACGGFGLLRTEGIRGSSSQFTWRWSKTHEEKLLARTGSEAPGVAAAPPVAERHEEAPKEMPTSPTHETPAPPVTRPRVRTRPDWPGFRGPQRDGVIRGLRIKTDWAATPPVELWRRDVGPGWSSFAAGGGLLYTQEQRGNFEVVACYQAATGKPVWTHRDATRFWESNAGPGPRGTPTLSDGRVYTFGATGILDALDAASGAVVWTRNVASDTGAKLPDWGFSSSPLVLDDAVIVAASGRLAAYDLATGKSRWVVQSGGGSYSSPQLLTIGGVAQVLLLNSSGVASVAPADGKVLWKHEWKGFTALQPALTADGGVLITTGSSGGGAGTRRLAVLQGPEGWKAEERWTSRGLKPYFNDLVVHKGYAFGFDGSILACIDLQDGHRVWKGGRYGNGQLVLLPDQDLLLVVSEEGELALVAAAPGEFNEIARFRAIEGKTWNHPALSGDTLLVRNGEQMAAFRLPLAGG
jgi:hypothetical protein